MQKNNDNLIQTRLYGTAGPTVFVLHGGPAAPGYMVPVARGLADYFRVVEPFQRPSCSDRPLTVGRHIDDLHVLIESICKNERPLIVGHSWGAMLALAYAAAYPNTAAALVLVGCGTFDIACREKMQTTRANRMTPAIQARFDRLEQDFPDLNKRFSAAGRLYQQIDSYDLVPLGTQTGTFDLKAHEETWQDMLRLQAEGVYPATFSTITAPVLMLHGDHDPHPGEMIRDTLKQTIPHLQYRAWPQCGHYPWLEKHAAADFYTALTDWLRSQSTPS